MQSENLGRQDVAEALGGTVSAPQRIRSLFGRPAFFIPRYAAVLRRVSDKVRSNNYGKDAAALIDDGNGFPTFAELFVANRLRTHSWDCAWVSVYGGFRAIREWPWDVAKPSKITLPSLVDDRLQKIAELRRSLTNATTRSFGGVADVVAWRNGEVLMIECKHAKEDRLRSTQEEWLHAALMYGLPSSDLGVFEWRFAS